MKKNEFVKMLIEGGIEPNEAKCEVEIILSEILKKTKEELLFENNFNEEKILPVLSERIETRRPIQYILKIADFMGEKFIVDESVLIPRDETEILVREGIKIAHKICAKKILDIGVGSGIISCMLGKNLNEAEILGVDVSLEALNTAFCNMKKFNLVGKVMFRKSDIFSNITEKFDIIISNPPYIPEKMKEEIQTEVKFEPETALFTKDNDGVYFYEKIIKNAPKFLNKGGYLLFEMMQNQAILVKKLLIENGFQDISIIKDLAGIERVIQAHL